MADMDKGVTDLVRRLQADPGDEAAHRELDESYRAHLVRFSRTRLDDPNNAEDCVQDVFQDVFAGIGNLRDPRAFEGWMFRIARRRISNYNSDTEPTTRPDNMDADVPDLPDPVTDVERDVRMRELLGTVSDAIDSLQPPLDAVMRTFIVGGGLPGSELAPRFGWDTKKADHELNRARRGLFAALETLVVVRTGRGACAQLNDLCGQQRIGPGRKTRLSRDQRRNVHRHIVQCDICRPQAHAARDRGRWALGPGIAQLADQLRRRRSGSRLVAAAAVMIAIVSLPAASDWLRPGHGPERPQGPVAFAPPAPPQPTPTPAPSESQRPRKPPAAPHSPRVSQPVIPADSGGDNGRPGGGGGGDRGGGGESPSPPRTPPPTSTPPPPRTPLPPSPETPPSAGTQRCTTSIALDPLTVRVNAVLLCVSVSVGR